MKRVDKKTKDRLKQTQLTEQNEKTRNQNMVIQHGKQEVSQPGCLQDFQQSQHNLLHSQVEPALNCSQQKVGGQQTGSGVKCKRQNTSIQQCLKQMGGIISSQQSYRSGLSQRQASQTQSITQLNLSKKCSQTVKAKKNGNSIRKSKDSTNSQQKRIKSNKKAASSEAVKIASSQNQGNTQPKINSIMTMFQNISSNGRKSKEEVEQTVADKVEEVQIDIEQKSQEISNIDPKQPEGREICIEPFKQRTEIVKQQSTLNTKMKDQFENRTIVIPPSEETKNNSSSSGKCGNKNIQNQQGAEKNDCAQEQNMAPLLQKDNSHQFGRFLPDQNGPRTEQDQQMVILAQLQVVEPNTNLFAEEVQKWKKMRPDLVGKLISLLHESNDQTFSKFQKQLNTKEGVKQFEKGLKIPSEINENCQTLSSNEKVNISMEIERFANLISPKDLADFQLSDASKIPIFKIFAHLVDSSQLDLPELSRICEKYLVAQLKNILHDLHKSDLTIKVSSMIKKKKFQVSDLIQFNAERKSYGVKNFLQKAFPINLLSSDQLKLVQSTDNLDMASLFTWEISNSSVYLSSERQKQLPQEKSLRFKTFSKARLLEKIIGLVDKLKREKDIPKLNEEYEKYTKMIEKEALYKKKELEKMQLKQERDRIEQGKQKLREQERILKEQLKEDEKQQKLLLKQQQEKEKAEKQAQLEREKKIKQEQQEQEKRARLMKIEKERQEKQEKLEKEKIERQEKLDREKKERLERLEKEKQEKLEKLRLKDIEKQEKERKLKEEAEMKALLEAKNKPKIDKFFTKQPKDVQDPSLEPSNMTDLQSKDQPDLYHHNPQKKRIIDKFNQYGLMNESIKIQSDCINKFGYLQLERNNFGQTNQDEGYKELTDEEEKINKKRVGEYFRVLVNADPYIGMRDQYNIVYQKMPSKPVKHATQHPTYGSVQISHNVSPVKGEGSVCKLKTSSTSVITRRKCIIIEGSPKILSFSYYKVKIQGQNASSKLSCRNPFRPDENILNYDMDTEDELAEEQGEDLPDEQISDDEEEDLLEEQENQGFIVDDDYLSVSEMNYSNMSRGDEDKIQADLERKKAIIQRNRECKQALRDQVEGPKIFIFSKVDCNLMINYRATSFVGTNFNISKPNNNFPLEFREPHKKSTAENGDDSAEEKRQGLDPNAINLKLSALLLMVHGSLESKTKLIDDFNEQNPECSKNSIEKKFRECFMKDKRGHDPRQRYYASEDFLKQLSEEFPGGLENPELLKLAQQRIQPLLDEIRQAQAEIDERKERKVQEQERERQELLHMRQEEQNQRDLKKLEEKLLRDKEKALLKQQQEEEKARKLEEKQRQRDIKLREKQEEHEMKVKQREEIRLQKEREKDAVKKEMGEKRHKKNANTPAKTGTGVGINGQANKNIVQLLQKRTSHKAKDKKIKPQISENKDSDMIPQKKPKLVEKADNQKSLTNFFKKSSSSSLSNFVAPPSSATISKATKIPTREPTSQQENTHQNGISDGAKQSRAQKDIAPKMQKKDKKVSKEKPAVNKNSKKIVKPKGLKAQKNILST